MNVMTDEPDMFRQIGNVAANVVNDAAVGLISDDIEWDGNTITEAGVYKNISLDIYHGRTDLFDAPSVSKSVLKYLAPPHGGSPKAFWGRWSHNPNRVKPKSTPALDFGKATHALLLGDEVFSESFVVRPSEYPDSKTGEMKPWNMNSNYCKAWVAEQGGKTILAPEQIEIIQRIADDASNYPLVKQGILNGRAERTMCFKDRETGLWVRARPDVISADGIFADLKTTGKFEEDFLERQVFEAAYYMQAGMTRMACRELGLAFDTFVLLYVLNDEVPDTTHVELSEHDIERGELMVRWCLRKIRECLNSGEWPGSRLFGDGTRYLQMKNWHKELVDRFLDLPENIGVAA